MAEFKSNFKYSNIGTVVGTLCYFRPLERKDGTQYGGEFLINVQGHGSVNVRVPNMGKVEEILADFPVENRPRVRVAMTQVDMFFAQSGKVYTNFTSFAPFKEVGDNIEDTAKGNISGEVIKMKNNADGSASLMMVVFSTDKDGQLIKNYQGQAITKNIRIEVVDPQLVAQVNKEVQVGTNLVVGYSFVNKNDVSYDEYGLPIGNGERVTRVEAGKLVVNANGKKEEPKPQPKQEEAFDPFASNDPFAFDLNEDDIPF